MNSVTRRKPRATTYVLALGACAGLLLPLAAQPVWAATDAPDRTLSGAGNGVSSFLDDVDFETPGIHTYTVPAGVTTLQLLAAGGAGGDTCVAGGFGTQVLGDLVVQSGDVLTITVGGRGGTATRSAAGAAIAEGGFNGGGDSTISRNKLGVTVAGGGGATEIRLKKAANGGSKPESLLLIAGGGGGAGACFTNDGKTTPGGFGGANADGKSGANLRSGTGPTQVDDESGEQVDDTIEATGTYFGGKGGRVGKSKSDIGGSATEGGGGGGGVVGGTAGSAGDHSSSNAMKDMNAGAGGGGAGTSAYSEFLLSPQVETTALRDGGRVSISPVAAQSDTILLGDSFSERQHALFATSFSGTGFEAGVSRRYTGHGDPMKSDNFRYNSGISAPETGTITVTITETYPGGSLVKRNYGVYFNNTLVHTRNASSSVAGVLTYEFTVDASRFAHDSTLKVMVMNIVNSKTDASIHSIQVRVD